MNQTAETATPPSKPLAQASGAARNHDAEKSERLWIIAIGAMVVIQLWFGMIGTSFWLDETGTWWIVKDGAAEAVRRAFSWSGQSPLFYLVAWLSSRVFGLNEVALRIPSVLAMTGAIYFLHRIAERLYDRASATVVAFVFLCVVSFYAVDARPYALAMLCLTASTWALLRWLDANRPLDAFLYATIAALAVYAHCILSMGLAAGVIYAAVTVWKEPRRLMCLAFLQIAIALVCVPLVPELRSFYATRSTHTFTSLPTVGDLLAGFIPCSIAGALILMTWVYMAVRGRADIAGKCTRRAALLIGTWALFAPLVLFLLPAFADLRLFVDRYYSSALPGQALLVGGMLSSIRSRVVRKALLLVLGAASILAQGRLTANSHGNEDWRAAMAFVQKEAGPAPVLLVSPFAEAVDFKALKDPRMRDILFAPELRYGEPVRSVRLPHAFAGSDTADLENVAEQVKNERRFFFLNDKPDRSYELWLLGRLGPRCKSEPVEQSFGLIRLARFTCESRH
jgi:mannosyltransferase